MPQVNSDPQCPLFSVIIPSYKRAEYLQNCLGALCTQTMPDFEVLCVCRPADMATRECIAGFAAEDRRFREVLIDQLGVVAALNRGLSSANNPAYIAFSDDDTEAPPGWLEAILEHFGHHPECGAVGGPDRLQIDHPALRDPPMAKRVGIYSWTGRFYANHHCPIASNYTEAAVLKGVNMTYRYGLVRGMVIGEGLRGGDGAQVGWEQSLAACVLRQGKKLHFVREAWLMHFISPRKANDERLGLRTQFALDTSYNNAYVLLRYQPMYLAVVTFLRGLVVGSRFIPGFLRLPLQPTKWRVTLMHLRPSFEGAWAGFLAR